MQAFQVRKEVLPENIRGSASHFATPIASRRNKFYIGDNLKEI